VAEHVHAKLPDLRDFEILIRVYANMQGLGTTYYKQQVLEQPSHEKLQSFVRGFNAVHPLCDITDAGFGKECADVKLNGKSPVPLIFIKLTIVTGLFKLCVSDVHCKHIIFGGSADNGYARLLVAYAGDEVQRERITMLEGPPFALELRRLADKFKTTSFPRVFRDTKLSDARSLFGHAAPANFAVGLVSPTKRTFASMLNETPAKNPNPSFAAPPTYSENLQQQQAGMLNDMNNGHNYQIADNSDKNNLDKYTIIYKNSKGERVDSYIAKPSFEIMGKLKSRGRKLCNNHHFFRNCQWGDNCTYDHAEISEEELNAQRWIARGVPCKGGLGCENEYCTSGHACPDDPCTRVECKFPRAAHGISRADVRPWN
jgi:hypothetical protein